MPRTQILPGVFLTEMPADKFKRCRISLNFIMPSNRETATAYAVLPYLLERGYEDCPDMTALSIKLSSLYGASLSADSSTQGPNRVISIGVGGIKQQFATQDIDLYAEYTRLLIGVAFRPCFENGLFSSEVLAIESGKLYDLLMSEQNNKRSYCVRQARRRFFGDSPNGVEPNGYIDEVASVTAEQLTAVYHDMVKSAQIEVIVQGADANAVAAELKGFLCGKERAPVSFPAPFAEELSEFKSFSEALPTTQGKICKIYNVAEILSPDEAIRMRLACAVFGSLPTSRLFVNVREKQSLCYYCVAIFGTITSTVTVDSGVEHVNAERALVAIDEELKKLTETEVELSELDDAKRQFINQLNAAADSLAAIESWCFAGIIKQDFTTIEHAKEIINAATPADVKRLLSMLKPAVSYTLTGTTENE